MKLVVALAIGFCLLGSTVSANGGLEIVSFGDSVWRDNNLTSPPYYSPQGGWSETRLLFGNRSRPTIPRPYFKTNLALSSRDVPEENTVSYGFGIEVRPLANNKSLAAQPWLEWLTRTRAYAEYLNQSFPQSEKPDWNPRHNLIVGFDVWREYGAADPNRYTERTAWWAELYVGAAYHSTNFYLDDYDSIRCGLNAKTGIRYGKPAHPVMPYVVLDLNATSRHRFFWENRLISGVGLRTEVKTGKSSKLKLYAERVWILSYLKDEPAASEDVPSDDTRIGLSYQWNRY